MEPIRTFLAASIALCLLMPAEPANAQEKLGQTSQLIVVGTLVGKDGERRLGLVTVNGGCSGTLLNRYWVLTADHCVAADGRINGMLRPPSQLRVTATWSAARPAATKVVRYAASHGLDVALIFLGEGDFGEVDRRLIHHSDVDTGMTLRKYGRGISEYAKGSGATAIQSSGGGTYRTAAFTPSRVTSTAIVLPANGAAQVGNGGDSGGPDFVAAGATGAVMGIAGVQSTCAASGYVQGKPMNWTWATGISVCTSASLSTIRDDIQRHMRDTPVDLQAARLKASPDLAAAVLGAPGRQAAATIESPAVAAALPSTAACAGGFVWRVAQPEDLVCVTPSARTRTARENAEAASRTDPSGAYGPNSCRAGYVWREALPTDLVCVTPQVRALVRQENAAGPSRLASRASALRAR